VLIWSSRLDRAGLPVGGAAAGGALRSSGGARGLEVRLELLRGTGGTGGMSLSTGGAFRRDDSDPIRLGSSMPPEEKSIAGSAGGLVGALGMGLVYDSPAVEKDTASSSSVVRCLSCPASGPGSS